MIRIQCLYEYYNLKSKIKIIAGKLYHENTLSHSSSDDGSKAPIISLLFFLFKN